ncbi:Sterile alpha motif domain-containing protein 3 [Holothuria leucospilota]|uniref:Sterile alpha motif domain-containing protein 3 n=1 Tax=Holothuria leucospilota TaxID=206669 RepID=A0A9Q1BTZ7_HOLLE|nr:Sterile alpha motif domain-containing protein 3 [Holothuria leucospilota]
MVNYLPDKAPSEDTASISVHKEWMKTEKMKKKPNFERVAVCMDATLSHRRHLIIKDAAPLGTIKAEYPWLFDEDEICKEFGRIQGPKSRGIKELLKDGLQKYGDAVLKVCKLMNRTDPSFAWAVDQLPLQRNEDSKKDATAVAAVFGIPLLFKEKIRSFLLFADENTEDTPALFIKGNGSTLGECTEFSVFLEGEEVGSCSHLLPALSAYVAAYYVFNLAYPTAFKKTMAFFQKIILNIQDNLKFDRSVLSILEKINQNL